MGKRDKGKGKRRKRLYQQVTHFDKQGQLRTRHYNYQPPKSYQQYQQSWQMYRQYQNNYTQNLQVVDYDMGMFGASPG